MSEVEFLKTIKKNLPDGVKKQFGKEKDIIVITDENYNKFIEIKLFIGV